MILEERSLGTMSLLGTLLVIFLLGTLTYLRNQDYRSPLSLWESALRVDPENPRAHLGVGVAELGSGDLPSATSHLLAAYRLSHKGRDVRAEALNNLAIVYTRQGKRGEALAVFRQILAAEPDNQRAHYNLAELLLEKAKPGSPEILEGARSVAALESTMHPNHPRLLTAQALLALREERTEEALTYLFRLGLEGLNGEGTLLLWGETVAVSSEAQRARAADLIRSLGRNPSDILQTASVLLEKEGRPDLAARLQR